ncbi:hypothetical protein G6O69_33065 [Pseudenhygromyxa sp. WMMC2535]|uniref:hypothetical protein n=1 Tax=Pseudenhygromyxa sp. WMMC2535 TaxID=2712867 RepID=UPI0015958E93|nr:hypothetical protein [Pseudenhygromyxa sp. WMMC2535]NVB42700.1 hypothetical protein [Pseudenhygromyxa sp. WMMC2535]
MQPDDLARAQARVASEQDHYQVAGRDHPSRANKQGVLLEVVEVAGLVDLGQALDLGWRLDHPELRCAGHEGARGREDAVDGLVVAISDARLEALDVLF